MKKIEAEIKMIISDTVGKEFNLAPIHLTWRQLGVDSLDLLDIITRCEIQFRVKITDNDAGRLFTLKDMTQLIELKIRNKER